MTAHEDLVEIDHPNPYGLDERIKNLVSDQIKSNLEISTSVASQNPTDEHRFVNFIN